MSKKIKRQVRKTSGTSAPAIAPAMSVSSTNGTRLFEREFTPDYTPVIKDLKRIGMLASSFFVILLILAFFLR